MKLQKKSKLFIIGILLGITAIALYQFLWGKLFAYSPIKTGFTKYELRNVVVYIQEGSENYNYTKIDSLIPSVEQFHRLNFIRKPEIIFFRDADSYYQRTTTKARFYAYPNGSLLVSPWAVQEALDGKISMEIYLRHELSHTLLYQHMDFITAYFIYPQWLLEGIAVYSSNQMGTSFYPDRKKTYEYIRKGSFLHPSIFNTKKADDVKLNVNYKATFAYSEFGCIVEYLILKYGKEKFFKYMISLSDSYFPEKVFKDVYGIDFNVCIENFRQHVKESNYRPMN